MNKRAQSEMVGFALIIIIVGILIVIGLSFMGNDKKENARNKEVENLIQGILEYTTNCSKNYGGNFQSINQIIKMCSDNRNCQEGKNSCDILKFTLEEIMSGAYIIGENYPTKGYNLFIGEKNKELIDITQGIETKNFFGAIQQFEGEITVQLTVYS